MQPFSFSTVQKSPSLVGCPSGPLVIPPSDTFAEADSSSPTVATPILSLVIPTYNESNNIASIVRLLSERLDSSLAGHYELIVVDDNSPDQTWAVAQRLMGKYARLRVMRRSQEKGLSSAVIRGWQVAQGSVLGVIDADLQHPPETLTALLNSILRGADLAVASRHIEGGGVSDWSLIRRILSRGAQFLGLLILPNVVGRVSDPMSGYFLVKRSAIADYLLHPKGYKILLEVLGRGKIGPIAEVGYVFQERASGDSKVTWHQYLDYLHHLWRLRLGGHKRHSASLRRPLPLWAFVRFGIVGLSGVLVDMGLLYQGHTLLGLPLTRSKLIAAEVAIVNNFIWNDLWTFRAVSHQQQGWSARLKRFLKFNLICLSGLVLNVLVLNLVYNWIFGQRWAYLANLIAIGVVTLWNFWLNYKLSWRVTQVDRGQ